MSARLWPLEDIPLFYSYVIIQRTITVTLNRGYACKKRKPALGAQDSRASLESYCYRAIPVTLVLGPAGAASERMQVRETEIIQ